MNTSTGNNMVNVTTYTENNLGSSINLTVGFYKTSNSWFYTSPQAITSDKSLTSNIDFPDYVEAEPQLDKINIPGFDKIIATDPSTISERRFYQYESAIINDSLGSGDPSLDRDGINWILKAEDFFNKEGIELKDEENRHSVITWSYLHNKQYDKALEELKKIKDKDQTEIEMPKWIISHKGTSIKNDNAKKG